MNAVIEYNDGNLVVNYSGQPFSNSGIVSRLTWNNPDLKKGLRQMFGCPNDEHIIAVKVSDDSITAYFERGEFK